MRFKYCPFCGEETTERQLGDEGMVPYCTKCDRPLFDMFSTSIITAVLNECGEVALLRQNYVSTANYVCVAGYIKPGESAEETVIREVKEELGLDAEAAEFIKSYPYEKKDMLMLGFKTTVKKKDFTLSGEVDSAEWVKLEDAPALLREGGIAWRLVREIAGM
ncbi:MAG: NUDIX domain-containing protein [Lachnospiraceae bacterium]|nr:NUDIX domain-containing protein [Lachnospiraceae bacterium]